MFFFLWGGGGGRGHCHCSSCKTEKKSQWDQSFAFKAMERKTVIFRNNLLDCDPNRLESVSYTEDPELIHQWFSAPRTVDESPFNTMTLKAGRRPLEQIS